MTQKHSPAGTQNASNSEIQQELGHSEHADLWQQLESLEPVQPSENLRREFYDQLSQQTRRRRSMFRRLLHGFRQITAPQLMASAASLAIGLALGLMLQTGAPPAADDTTLTSNGQMDQMQQQITDLSSLMALSLLEKDHAADRLRGVHAASSVITDDADASSLQVTQLAMALLERAANDGNNRVRSAAVEALGPQLSSSSVADELFSLLEKTESAPLQLQLVELIMRWGDGNQLDQLWQLATHDRLLPVTKQFVLGRMTPESDEENYT